MSRVPIVLLTVLSFFFQEKKRKIFLSPYEGPDKNKFETPSQNLLVRTLEGAEKSSIPTPTRTKEN